MTRTGVLQMTLHPESSGISSSRKDEQKNSARRIAAKRFEEQQAIEGERKESLARRWAKERNSLAR